MTTTSRPAVGTGGFSDADWSTRFESQDGLINDNMTGGAEACAISYNNATNEVTIGTGQVSVNGFTLTITAPHVLYLAPATSGPVTYYISAHYTPSSDNTNPASPATALGPVRLVAPTAAPAEPRVVLYEVTRSPSQALTAAQVVDKRRWIGTTTTSAAFITTGVWPRGSVHIEETTGNIRLRVKNAAGTGLTWQSLTSPALIDFPNNSPLVAYDTPAKYYRGLSRIFLQGTLKRSAGGSLSTGGDVLLGTMPANARPTATVRFQCTGHIGQSLGVRVYTNGQVIMTDPGTATQWIDLSAINYRSEI